MGVFLSENAAMPPGQQVKVHKSASFVDILEVCKFTTFCDRKGYLPSALQLISEIVCMYVCIRLASGPGRFLGGRKNGLVNLFDYPQKSGDTGYLRTLLAYLSVFYPLHGCIFTYSIRVR